MATFCGTYYREKRRSCQLLLFFNSLWGLFWASIHPVSVIFFAERWFAEKGTMEKALTKVGSSWMSQKVRKDVSDIADDLSVRLAHTLHSSYNGNIGVLLHCAYNHIYILLFFP